MAPLSKLTLTSYRRTQPNRDPVEERRSKTLTALEQQKLVLAAAQKGQEHTVTIPGQFSMTFNSLGVESHERQALRFDVRASKGAQIYPSNIDAANGT